MRYKILNNNILQKDATKLYRIQALKSFSDVKEGDIGDLFRVKIISLNLVIVGFMIMRRLAAIQLAKTVLSN